MNDKEVIILFIGILFLNIFIKVLKNIIKQPRPIKTNTYGMPSSKSTITSFILFYLICINKFKLSTNIYLLILLILIILIKYIYQEHTLLQIFVGFIIGGIFGFIFGYLI